MLKIIKKGKNILQLNFVIFPTERINTAEFAHSDWDR